MAMRLAALILATLMAIAPLVHGIAPASDPQAVDKWFNRAVNSRPTLTKLHFFIHDIIGLSNDANATTIPIAKAEITDKSPTNFGLLYVMDSPLTTGPEINSEIVGYCQGTFTFSGREEVALLLTLNFVFTSGRYSGSTLSILGRKTRTSTYREYPIVGGSGHFRLATGVTVDWTYTGPVVGRAPVEAQVWVLHYDAEPYLEEI